MQLFDGSSIQDDQNFSLGHPHLQTLEAYWQKLRTAGDIPSRAALDPARIEHVLPSTFILQRVAAGTARFRVAGQRIHEILKMDPRGMPFSTLFDQASHDDIRLAIEAVCSEPAILGLSVQSPASLLRGQVMGAVLLLPMRDTDGNMSRILGALVAPENTSQRPRRFAIHGAIPHRHDRLGPARPQLVSLMPEPAQNESRPDTVARPALKLVVNNG